MIYNQLFTETSHIKSGYKALINVSWDTNQLISIRYDKPILEQVLELEKADLKAENVRYIGDQLEYDIKIRHSADRCR